MSNQKFRRSAERSFGSDTFAAAAWILATPRIKTDAIVVCGGMGEDARIRYATKRRRETGTPWLLLSGINPKEESFKDWTIGRLRRDGLIGPNHLGILTQVVAENTPDQAKWIVEKVGTHGIRSCELHASPYHIVRAYLTILAAMSPANPFILTARPTPVPPGYVIPESEIEGIGMVPGEYNRIETYQSKGDVATFPQLRNYLDWLWEQSEFTTFV